MTLLAPMKLYEPKDPDVESYLSDDRWFLEQKMDGIRTVARISAADANGERNILWCSSNGGLLRSTTAAPHLPALSAVLHRVLDRMEFTGSAILDGELVGSEFHLFDAPYMQGMHNEDDAYRTRRLAVDLVAIRSQSIEVRPSVFAVPVARTEPIKRQLWAALLARHVEGAVAKLYDAPYVWGVRSRDQVKLKRTYTAHLLVKAVNGRTAKTGSAELMTAGGVRVGSASLIGKDPAIDVGSLVEVRFLCWTGTALLQPRIIGLSSMTGATNDFESYSKEAVPLPV